MKKKLIILVLIVLAAAGLLYHFNSRKACALDLPQPEVVECISLHSHKNLFSNHCNKDVIQSLIKDITSIQSNSRKESVQDCPTNAKAMITVEFQTKDKKYARLYLYKRGKDFYLEQPYNGIYKIHEEDYKLINKYLEMF